MSFDPVIISIPIFFGLIILELIIDWYRVSKKSGKSWYRLNDALTNIGCGVLDQVTGLFTKVFTVAAYTFFFSLSQKWFAIEIPSNWIWYILFFILVDFFYYLAHRWSHQVNFLWMGHVVHHQSEDYNLSVALRQGAVQKLFTFWVYFPLAFVGFPPEWFIMAIGFNLLYQFWIHTEAIGKMGWFELVFNTPSHHRVHHGRDAKYIDKNHAGVFIIWDRMLGTFQEEEEKPNYGITVPTKSFNAIEAHVQPFVRTYHGFVAQNGFSNKWNYLFQKPGWVPKNEVAPVSKVDLKKKYEVKISKSFQFYLLVQFLVNMGIGAVALNNLEGMTFKIQVLLLIHAFWYLTSLGLLFDKRKYGNIVELSRHCFNLGLIFALFSADLFHWIPIAGIGFTLLSFIWFVVIKKKENS